MDNQMQEYMQGINRNLLLWHDILVQDHGKTAANAIMLAYAFGGAKDFERDFYRVLDKPARFPQYQALFTKHKVGSVV